MNAQAPAAIIEGALVDAKNVAAHKCVRLSIDVPAELGAQIVKAFGWPTMAEPVHVAVARLNVEAAKREREHKSFEDCPAAQQAALIGKEPKFWAYLREEHKLPCEDRNKAADHIRWLCGVESRADILPGTKAETKWQLLCSGYLAWEQAERVGA